MNNLIKRTLTGLLFTGTLLACLLLSPYSLFGLVLVLTMLTLHEFFSIISVNNTRPQLLTGYLSGACIMVSTGLVLFEVLEPFWLLLNLPVLFVAFIYELYTKSEQPFQNIAYTVLGVFYIAVPFSLLLVLPYVGGPDRSYHPQLAFGYFLLLWASDTGAYLTGMAFGKHRLFERISPKKSWEGTIGGALLNGFIAWCCAGWFPELSYLHWTVTGLLIVITGTFGDLAESLLKRSLHIKDSGKLLPGHGGLLDRFDALLISIPFVVAYLVLVSRF